MEPLTTSLSKHTKARYTVEYLEVKWLALVPVPKTTETRCRQDRAYNDYTSNLTQFLWHS